MANEKRLIDANAFRDFWNKNYRHQYANDTFLFALANFPTVDAVEVVHAKWQNEGFGCWLCSSCLEIFTFDNYGDVHPKDDCGCNYCPNCGAKMDGDGNG